MNPHEWMDSMADHAIRCCSGNCRQGRECPLRQKPADHGIGQRLLAYWDVVAWAAALMMLVGVFRG